MKRRDSVKLDEKSRDQKKKGKKQTNRGYGKDLGLRRR
jgi:hypothetical protein